MVMVGVESAGVTLIGDEADEEGRHLQSNNFFTRDWIDEWHRVGSSHDEEELMTEVGDGVCQTSLVSINAVPLGSP